MFFRRHSKKLRVEITLRRSLGGVVQQCKQIPFRFPYIVNFYPRPPGGGRPLLFCPYLDNRIFLSTPSGWRATDLFRSDEPTSKDFYPRPPGGGRQAVNFKSFFKISHFYPRPPGGGRQQKRTKFSSVFAKKGEEFASLRRGKRKICRWRFKKDKFWVLIWCEGSRKSVCALASHCG